MACQPVEVRLPYREETQGGLLDAATGTLFGPLFDSLDDADDFDTWMRNVHGRDPRSKRDHELTQLKCEWEATRKAGAA